MLHIQHSNGHRGHMVVAGTICLTLDENKKNARNTNAHAFFHHYKLHNYPMQGNESPPRVS